MNLGEETTMLPNMMFFPFKLYIFAKIPELLHSSVINKKKENKFDTNEYNI